MASTIINSMRVKPRGATCVLRANRVACILFSYYKKSIFQERRIVIFRSLTFSLWQRLLPRLMICVYASFVNLLITMHRAPRAARLRDALDTSAWSTPKPLSQHPCAPATCRQAPPQWRPPRPASSDADLRPPVQAAAIGFAPRAAAQRRG